MKIKDIKAGINKILFEGTKVEVISNDVRDGYMRPSFFVTFSSKNVPQNKYLSKREMDVRIHYFPSTRDEHSIECYDMQDKLENLFGMHIALGDRVITLGDTECFVQDGVLMFDFPIEFYETHEVSKENDREIMQELAVKYE